MAAMLGRERGYHLQSCILNIGTKRQPKAGVTASACLTKVPDATVVLGMAGN